MGITRRQTYGQPLLYSWTMSTDISFYFYKYNSLVFYYRRFFFFSSKKSHFQPYLRKHDMKRVSSPKVIIYIHYTMALHEYVILICSRVVD